jgi:hypothetical protein
MLAEDAMPSYRFETHVNAPPERVFDLWTDLDRMPEWIGGLIKVTDRLSMYYGAADTVIGLATAKLSDVLAVVRAAPEPRRQPPPEHARIEQATR